ncbi:MAG: DUF2171 domain-containing protein [Gemmataceae bacterium]|nr:DUF2171 domain-containing protein [Gemmataceae bacterium]
MTMTKNIREHMEVIGSCGSHLGVVDHVDGNSIKLAKNDPNSGGVHHWIPMDWVERIDEHVHLNKNCGEAMRDWQTERSSMGA